MSAFTPGPWTVEQCNKHDRYNYHIRNDVKGGFALVEDWAEATLIAAAPEMLAELEDVLIAIQCQCDEAYTRRGGHEPNAFCYLIPDIDAVITKARDES